MHMANLTDDHRQLQLFAFDAATSPAADEPSVAEHAANRPDQADASNAGSGTAKTGKEEELPPAEPVSRKEVEAFLADPSLKRAMLRVVHGRVNDADVEDVMQEARLAIARAKMPPNEPKKRRQYALAIARNKAIEWYVREEKDDAEEVPLDDARTVATDDSGIERVIDGEYLDKIADTVPTKQHSTMECLFRHLMGESLADMAREMNVQYGTLYKRVTTLHRRMAETGRTIGGLLMMLIMLMGAWNTLRPQPQSATPKPREEPTTAPPEPTAPPASTELRSDNGAAPSGSEEGVRKAAELRGEAFQACAQDDWALCAGALDDASRLDPSGESDPLVQAARADVNAAAMHQDQSWSPKRPRAYEGRGR
jgi:RNA polymerase sigma factor (sigma-70 family)